VLKHGPFFAWGGHTQDDLHGPVFEMARQQFAVIADYLDTRGRARPAALPQARDHGGLPHPCRRRSYVGIRRLSQQQHLTFDPTKGGTRFSPKLDIGEVAALAIWMSWKCGLTGLPYGGAKGGVALDPYSISKRELEGVSRRYMQEMIPFVGPHIDVMAPDMGTNEEIMAWFMDTYSMYQGKTVTEIATDKPVASGGTEGRREATGRGVAYLAERALQRIGVSPKGATAIVQGFGNVGSAAAATLAARRFWVSPTTPPAISIPTGCRSMRCSRMRPGTGCFAASQTNSHSIQRTSRHRDAPCWCRRHSSG
jgi:glutamate dehydrogenase (NAD(P)+)